MRKIRALIAIAGVACCGMFATQALATEWAGNNY